MKYFIFLIVLLINTAIASSQSSWSVKSEDGLVKAENYIGFDEGRDSVIVNTKYHKFRFSYHYPLFNTEIIEEIGHSFIVRSIKKVNRKMYVLVGVGGNLNFETQLNLIFIKKDKIVKHIVVKSIDKELRDVEFYYRKRGKEFVFPRRITNSNDMASIYELYAKENKLDIINPLKENLELYKSKFSFGNIGNIDMVYYKVKF